MGPQEPQIPQEPEQPVPQPPMQPNPQPQPQFIQQPQMQQFPQTQMPQPAGPVIGAPMPSPKKRLSKGALWGIIGGAVGLVLVIVGVVLALTVFNGPTKADYVQANGTVNDAIDAYNDAGDKFATYFTDVMTGSSSTSSSKSSFESAYSAYKDKISTLKDEKALKNSDVKKAYDTFATKNDDFVTFIDGFQSSADTLINMKDSCSYENASAIGDYSSKTLVSAYDAALGQCIEDLETVSKSQNKPLAEYASKLLDLYNKQRELFAELETANKSGDISAQYDARSNIVDQASDFDSLDSYTSITDKLDTTEPKVELQALGDVINKKAS